jgi:hypothetical protein
MRASQLRNPGVREDRDCSRTGFESRSMYVFVGGAASAGVDTGSEAYQALMAAGLRGMLNASVCHASIHDQGVRQHWHQLSCGVYR